MSCNKGYFVGGLFIGTIIGGALGILFAPSSGKETRNKMKNGAEEVFGNAYDQALEYGENLKEQVEDMTDSITDKVNQYKNQIENKIQEIQDEVNDDIAELNEELESLQNEENDSDALSLDDVKEAVADKEETEKEMTE